ncbi:unnamed protein product, partial [Amoebophrya sp. A120]|eukprot:GSA120T00012780001.1
MSSSSSSSSSSAPRPKSLSILMVSDFFYPGLGGVEKHIADLSATLVRRGHRVAVLTHAYENSSREQLLKPTVRERIGDRTLAPSKNRSSPGPYLSTTGTSNNAASSVSPTSSPHPEQADTSRPESDRNNFSNSAGDHEQPARKVEKSTNFPNKRPRRRCGVRYLKSGVRVYYAPVTCIPGTEVAFPTAFSLLPLLRNILLREQVDLVHAHQSTSAMAHECMFHAKTLGYKTVFTDHSLHSVTQPTVATIHINKVISVGLLNADHAICVSAITRHNLALKAGYAKRRITTIPNAIDCDKFRPEVLMKDPRGGSQFRGNSGCRSSSSSNHAVSTGAGHADTTASGANLSLDDPAVDSSHTLEVEPREKLETPRDEHAFSCSDVDVVDHAGRVLAEGNLAELSASAITTTGEDSATTPTTVTFVLMNRLTQRKGVQLLAEVIPKMCEKYGKAVAFIIGGDGEMRPELEAAVRPWLFLQGEEDGGKRTSRKITRDGREDSRRPEEEHASTSSSSINTAATTTTAPAR